MTIRSLINTLAPSTHVRIRIFDVTTIAGKTGNSGTQIIMERLRKLDSENAWVTCITPLHHAQELYIECVSLVQ